MEFLIPAEVVRAGMILVGLLAGSCVAWLAFQIGPRGRFGA